MSTTNRKQQREIEIAEKKVTDGVREFNELWRKVEEAQDIKERDKLMSDMKRELKRLQRLREQFRAWAEDPSIRDFSVLLEMRRLVETQMERFKDLEKEAKIKPFAKAGLQQKEKVDPAVEAKLTCESWLRSCIARLAEQVEQFEADAEALLNGCTDRCPPERVSELNAFIMKHDEQTAKLEQVLRLVENEQVLPQEVDETLKESMEHYLECSTLPDFVEDELMYEGFPLGEGLENVGRIQVHEARATLEGSLNSESTNEIMTPKESGRAKSSKTARSSSSKKSAKPELGRGSQRKGKGKGSSPASAASPSAPTNPEGSRYPAKAADHPNDTSGVGQQNPPAAVPKTPTILKRPIPNGSSAKQTFEPSASLEQGLTEQSPKTPAPDSTTKSVSEASFVVFTSDFAERKTADAHRLQEGSSQLREVRAGSKQLVGEELDAGIGPAENVLAVWQDPEALPMLPDVRSNSAAKMLCDFSATPASTLCQAEQAVESHHLAPPTINEAMANISCPIQRPAATKPSGYGDTSVTKEERAQTGSFLLPYPGLVADSKNVAKAHQQQLLLGHRSFAQAASQRGVGSSFGKKEPASNPRGQACPEISDIHKSLHITSPSLGQQADQDSQEGKGAEVLFTELKEAIAWEISDRSSQQPPGAQTAHCLAAISRARTPGLYCALDRLLDLEEELQFCSQPPDVWVREAVHTVLKVLKEHQRATPGSVNMTGSPGTSEQHNALQMDGLEVTTDGDEGSLARKSNSPDVKHASLADVADVTRATPPPTSILSTGSLDSSQLHVQPIQITRLTSGSSIPQQERPRLLPMPASSAAKGDTRRLRLDLKQFGKQQGSSLGRLPPCSRIKRASQAGSGMLGEQISAPQPVAQPWMWSSEPAAALLDMHDGQSPPGFSLPHNFSPPPPPPRQELSQPSSATFLLDITPQQQFLEHDYQKPYYASNIRHPLERALLSAGQTTMPEDADGQYRRCEDPVSVFQQTKFAKYNPSTLRPDEWDIASMWTPQVLPIIERPSFFEDTLHGKWPEAALFAFTFQPGTKQQMHAAELLKQQGWMFHTHYRKWFHRPESPAQKPREATSSYEKGEWIFWEPNMDEEGEGWCAHQTNQNFSFEYKHLCQ